MNYSLPVKNTLYFLQPTAVEEWQSADVPGVMGVLRRTALGDFEVIDAFPVDTIPSGKDLLNDVRFGYWFALARTTQDLRFDAFAMPMSASKQRNGVITLLSRTCGLVSLSEQNYAFAV